MLSSGFSSSSTSAYKWVRLQSKPYMNIFFSQGIHWDECQARTPSSTLRTSTSCSPTSRLVIKINQTLLEQLKHGVVSVLLYNLTFPPFPYLRLDKVLFFLNLEIVPFKFQLSFDNFDWKYRELESSKLLVFRLVRFKGNTHMYVYLSCTIMSRNWYFGGEVD